MKNTDFFKTSPMRESILNWYPFKAGTAILRFGVDTFAEGEVFDYIIAIDPPSFEPEALKDLRGILKPHGRLLMAFENRFGLRYWCGKRSPVTGLPFDRIAGRDDVPGKAELKLRLEQVGFEGQKWYYPMSDHWFAQDIYSENYLPRNYSAARFRPYVEPDYTLLMNEQTLYRDIIQNGVFEFFANAYLIEARCCGADKPCNVDYAAVTTYRSPERRFTTMLCNDGRAYKKALHPDAIPSLHRLAENHKRLTELGINVLPVELEGDCAVMPRVDQETLIDYWQRKQQEGRLDLDEVSSILDRIRDIIIGLPGAAVFPELVPANCFYEPENGELLFFDQEFSKEDWPVEAVLARLILSLAHSTLFAHPGIPELFEALKLSYGLAGNWGEYEGLEREFIWDVLNHAETVSFRRLRDVDEGQIAQNVRAAKQALHRQGLLDAIRAMGSRFAIYGYGKRGKEICSLLSFSGIKVPFAIDQRSPADAQIAVFAKAEDADFSGIDAILVSMKTGAEEAALELRGIVSCPVVTLNELYERIDSLT